MTQAPLPHHTMETPSLLLIKEELMRWKQFIESGAASLDGKYMAYALQYLQNDITFMNDQITVPALARSLPVTLTMMHAYCIRFVKQDIAEMLLATRNRYHEWVGTMSAPSAKRRTGQSSATSYDAFRANPATDLALMLAELAIVDAIALTEHSAGRKIMEPMIDPVTGSIVAEMTEVVGRPPSPKSVVDVEFFPSA